MSSRMRDNGINFVRRVVSIPRNMLDEFSRAMNQGMDLINGRTNYHHHHHNQSVHFQQPSTFPFQGPSNLHPQQQLPSTGHEQWDFLNTFELQYGTAHPFFYACRFTDALKMAREEHKLVFVYIHSQEHPFTSSFCRETLCSEVIVQFLDVNFVCWAGISDRGEGLQMGSVLGVSSFPFCAVLAPAAGDNLAVLQQLEGPVAPADLVEILQRTIEEQGPAFGSGRSRQEEKRMEDQRLREDQDIAYIAALQIDQEKERLQKKPSIKVEPSKPRNRKEISISEPNNVKPATVTAQTSQKTHTSGVQKAKVTQILIRFPNGERREHGFLCTDKVRAIYEYVDSLGLPGVENYRLISTFPRKVYDEDQLGLSVKESGLHPKASLFVELL
ncbi:Plant UBX domain-containing protein 10 [Striga hermonthica]|uniref:Plant UBX domain-containing protein 10 n=1 Tax=Striga hermonthica TaxID=68872 RepID=A0A9N7RAM2_STRHE|nr:Plant UBX domain-containing protein 10 [Striga hermonthica]